MSEEQAIEDGHRVVFEGALKGSKIGDGTEPPKVRFVRRAPPPSVRG